MVVDWQFDVDWDWNDSQSMTWTTQGYDANGEGLSPATASQEAWQLKRVKTTCRLTLGPSWTFTGMICQTCSRHRIILG